MGFGLFKKIKDAAKKGINWLKTVLPKAKKILDTIKPVVKELPNYTSNDKIKNYFENANEALDVTDSGLNAINNAINKHNYDDVKNWVNYEIRPRLKH